MIVALMVAAGTLGLLQLLASVEGETSAAVVSLDVAAALASPTLLLLVVRRPLAAGVSLGALAALSPVATPAATMAALRVARVRPLPTATAVAAIGVTGHLVQAWRRPVPALPFGWQAVVVLAVYAMLTGWGAFARTRRALLDSLVARARRAEEEQAARVAEARAMERSRLAREMHDVLAHRLSLLATYAGALEYRPDLPSERIAEAAGVIRASVHEALDDVRATLAMLRDDNGLAGTGADNVEGADGDGADDPPARHPLRSLTDLPRLVEESRRAGMAVELVADPGVGAGWPAPISHGGYRAVQEGLSNARRHAPGQPVTVTVEEVDDRLLVVVRNPVPGAGTGTGVKAGGGRSTIEPGYGLIGLGERASLLGGTVSHRMEGGDVVLRVELPRSV